MQNIEFKAELRDPPLARSICRALGASAIGTFEQTDTYFRLSEGRLKKRESRQVDPIPHPPDPSARPHPVEVEYIFYHRQDTAGPKLSRFTIYAEDQALERFGTRPLPVWVTVKKTRELYLIDHVRIHLDAVEGLGSYLEFEALVTPDRPVPRAHEALARLRAALLPALGEPISSSYSDLLAPDA